MLIQNSKAKIHVHLLLSLLNHVHAPFSPRFLMGVCSDGPFEIIQAKFEVRSSIYRPSI